jgi:DNA polymerase alpha subunit B
MLRTFYRIRHISPSQMGPFLDSTHPNLKSGSIDSTPAQLFHSTFTDNLKDFLATSPGSIVVIVPSLKDLISDHVVFPQAELGKEFSGDPVRRFSRSFCVPHRSHT